jgi:site-specific recombinase XerD
MAGLPLSQAIGEYLAWLELERHASTCTVEGYRGDLRRFSDFAGGDAGIPDIGELDREILRGYQRHLARLRTGPKRARRPLAISTRSRRLVALRSFLRFAAREEWLPGDLGTTIDVPKLPERLPKPLEAGDRDQLLAALPHDTLPEQRDRALILLLLSTGARISEILRLDRSDWKPDRLWVLGKGDRERVVQVTDKARAAIEEYLTARKDHSPALFISFQPASKATSSNRLTIAGAQYVALHSGRSHQPQGSSGFAGAHEAR